MLSDIFRESDDSRSGKAEFELDEVRIIVDVVYRSITFIQHGVIVVI